MSTKGHNYKRMSVSLGSDEQLATKRADTLHGIARRLKRKDFSKLMQDVADGKLTIQERDNGDNKD